MVLVEPRSSHVANLSNDIVANLLGKLKHWGLCVGAQQECQEGLILPICVHLKEGVEVWVGAGKGGPVAAGVRGGSFEPGTLPCGKVDESARGVGQATRHSAGATGVS